MEKVQINSKIEEIVKAHGFFLVDVVLRGDNHLRIIEVYMDGEKGVTAVDCANVSRDLNEAIQTLNLIESNYRLDISSPGVDRPLKFLEQYQKHINRKFEIEYGAEGENKLTAKLAGIDGNDLLFSVKETEYRINFSDIKKAKVLISF